MPLQVTDDALEPRPVLLEVPLRRSDKYHGDGFGVRQQRQRVIQRPVRLAGPVPGDQDALSDGFETPGVGDDEDRAADRDHDVLGPKPRGAIRVQVGWALAGDRQIHRLRELDQRCPVAVG